MPNISKETVGLLRMMGSGIISGGGYVSEGVSELMLGIKRRRRTEGWAVEISEGEAMNEHVSAWQRIGDSNKLWIASVLMVVVLTAAFVKMSSRTIARVAPAPPPRDAPSYFKNYQRYSDFASQFVHDKKFSDEIISARFVTPGRFKIVVPATVSADAVDYMSKMAAEQVRHEFQHKTIVLVYVRSAASRNLTLVATTQWKVKSKAEKSGYVVRLHDAASKVL